MIIIIKNHPYEYDVENISEIFFPYEKIKVVEGDCDDTDPVTVITEIDGNELIIEASVYDRHKRLTQTADEKTDRQNALSVLLYNTLSEILDIKYPWGLLYGVRPARRMHALTDNFSENEAKRIFKEKYLVNDAKTNLTASVMHSENKIISLSKDNSFSLYVSIPFCPSRCSYCSFVSHSIENTKKLVEPYVELLIKEIEDTGRYAKELGLRLESVYFGGGTPTTLSANHLEAIFQAIERTFDLSTNREYTVEAGRPDTVTEEKLLALKAAGVSRISINPQTFNDEVLKLIGRRHSAEETLKAYDLAVKCGFDNINMDFITGLPGDSLESFKSSISKGIALGAKSITVHTLSLKSGAYMATRENAFDSSPKHLVADMVDFSNKALSESGYHPYYMYRQGKSLGNLENVGWCKEGYDCLYNVFMMDETHTVLAVGAGAVIKLKDPKSGKIQRIYNYKYPYEYIDRFDEILRRKHSIKAFYDEYNL
ncbi:MAG: coproporphyrinogen dehydrogenase HemZ [Eubacterium sp.]|nr:coproporphyrinogen dehydrogenase HemZ [Eubacterium sp.]